MRIYSFILGSSDQLRQQQLSLEAKFMLYINITCYINLLYTIVYNIFAFTYLFILRNIMQIVLFFPHVLIILII